jgi:hypothetical protein
MQVYSSCAYTQTNMQQQHSKQALDNYTFLLIAAAEAAPVFIDEAFMVACLLRKWCSSDWEHLLLLKNSTTGTRKRCDHSSNTQQCNAHRMKLQVVLSSTVLSSVMLCIKPLATVGNFFAAPAAPTPLPGCATAALATASPAPLTAASVLAASAPCKQQQQQPPPQQ